MLTAWGSISNVTGRAWLCMNFRTHYTLWQVLLQEAEALADFDRVHPIYPGEELCKSCFPIYLSGEELCGVVLRA